MAEEKYKIPEMLDSKCLSGSSLADSGRDLAALKKIRKMPTDSKVQEGSGSFPSRAGGKATPEEAKQPHQPKNSSVFHGSIVSFENKEEGERSRFSEFRCGSGVRLSPLGGGELVTNDGRSAIAMSRGLQNEGVENPSAGGKKSYFSQFQSPSKSRKEDGQSSSNNNVKSPFHGFVMPRVTVDGASNDKDTNNSRLYTSGDHCEQDQFCNKIKQAQKEVLDAHPAFKSESPLFSKAQFIPLASFHAMAEERDHLDGIEAKIGEYRVSLANAGSMTSTSAFNSKLDSISVLLINAQSSIQHKQQSAVKLLLTVALVSIIFAASITVVAYVMHRSLLTVSVLGSCWLISILQAFQLKARIESIPQLSTRSSFLALSSIVRYIVFIVGTTVIPFSQQEEDLVKSGDDYGVPILRGEQAGQTLVSMALIVSISCFFKGSFFVYWCLGFYFVAQLSREWVVVHLVGNEGIPTTQVIGSCLHCLLLTALQLVLYYLCPKSDYLKLDFNSEIGLFEDKLEALKTKSLHLKQESLTFQNQLTLPKNQMLSPAFHQQTSSIKKKAEDSVIDSSCQSVSLSDEVRSLAGGEAKKSMQWPFELLLSASVLLQFGRSNVQSGYIKRIPLYNHPATSKQQQGLKVQVKAISNEFFEKLPIEHEPMTQQQEPELTEERRFTFCKKETIRSSNKDRRNTVVHESAPIAEKEIRIVDFDPQIFLGAPISDVKPPTSNLQKRFGSVVPADMEMIKQSRFSLLQIQKQRTHGYSDLNPQRSFEYFMKQKAKLFERVFEPFFISNSTSLLFQNLQAVRRERGENLKLSVMDIWEIYNQSQKATCKLYFKVSKRKDEHEDNFLGEALTRKITKSHPSNVPTTDSRRQSKKLIRRLSDQYMSSKEVHNQTSDMISDIRSLTNLSRSFDLSEDHINMMASKSDEKIVEEPDESASQSSSQQRPRGTIHDQIKDFKKSIFFGIHKDLEQLKASLQISSVSESSSFATDQERLPEMRKINQRYADYEKRKNDLESQVQYFEFEFKQVFHDGQPMVLFSITEITSFLEKLRDTYERKYLMAMETNYSHENMTPLNCILNSCSIAASKIRQAFNELQGIVQTQSPHMPNDLGLRRQNSMISNGLSQNSNITMRMMPRASFISDEQGVDKVLYFLKLIEQSAMLSKYYHSCQLYRFKIMRPQSKLELNPTAILQPESLIEEIVGIFEEQIRERKLGVFVGRCHDFSHLKVKTDWAIYKQILFNLVQNAVKYNTKGGDILVLLRCLPMLPEANKREHEQARLKFDLMSVKSSVHHRSFTKMSPHTFNNRNSGTVMSSLEQEISTDHYMFETVIIDSGIGIDKERQSQMFVPFSELRNTSSISKVKDFNIGMGLTCSRDLVHYLKGDIKIIESQKGRTVFAYKYPVKVERNIPSPLRFGEPNVEPGLVPIFGGKTTLNPFILQYLISKKLDLKILARIPSAVSQTNRLTLQTSGSGFSPSNQIKSAENVSLRNAFSIENPFNQLMQRGKRMIIRRRASQEEVSESSEERKTLSSVRSNDLESEQAEKPVSVIAPLLRLPLKTAKLVPPLKLDEIQQETNKAKKQGLATFLMMNNLKSQIERVESDIRRPFEDSSDGSYDKQRDIDNETVFDLKLDGGPWMKEDPEDDSENEIILVSARPPRKLMNFQSRMNDAIPSVVELQSYQSSEAIQESSKGCCPFRILVVDDIPFNLIPITSLIQDLFNIEPDTACNGLEALQMYKKALDAPCGCPMRGYQLILMDIQMPIMDGLQSSSKITAFINEKAREETQDIEDPEEREERFEVLKDIAHIVGISAFTNKKEKCLENGMKDVFNKPLHAEDLFLIIQRHLFRASKEELTAAFIEQFGEEKAQQKGLIE